MKLYEIREAYERLLEMEEEGTDISAYIGSIEEQIDDKLHSLALVYKNVSAESEGIKAEEKKLSARRKALENKAESIKSYMFSEMEALKINELKRPNAVLKIAKNPPKLFVAPGAVIPEKYKIITESINNAALKEDVSNGEMIEGVSIIQGTSLRIK